MIKRNICYSLIFLLFFSFFPESLFAHEDFFWEETKNISSGDARFPRAVNTQDAAYVFWEEVDSQKNQIFLSCRIYKNATNYQDKLRFAGPFEFSGDVPELYSAASTENGKVIVAVASGIEGIIIYSTDLFTDTFEKSYVPSSKGMIAPKLYTASNGKVRLFTSITQDDLFQLFCSDSSDGIKWSSFKKFEPGSQFRNPFLPVSISNGNTDIIIFQAQYRSEVLSRYSYQLFLTTTRDGSSWSNPILLTDQESLPDGDIHNFAAYQNQRPDVYKFGEKIFVVWERTETINSQLWICEINQNGLVPRTSRKITEQGNSSRAKFFEFDGRLFLSWFDTRTGEEKTYFAELIGEDWEEFEIVSNKNKNMFPVPIYLKENDKIKLGIITQRSNDNNNFIMATLPDTTVSAPQINPLSYKNGRKSREKDVKYQIVFPSDSSGIKGYSYTWGKDNELVPEPVLQFSFKDKNINVSAEEDGTYYLKIRVCDNAGNWSNPSTIQYRRDIIPPQKPTIQLPVLDEYGFLEENTFSFSWKSSEQDDDIAGYNYKIEYLGDIPKKYTVNKTHIITETKESVIQSLQEIYQKYSEDLNSKSKFNSTILSTNPYTYKFNNEDNGVYKFSVVSIDEVGNVSEPESILFVLNKYQPQTLISSAYQKSNEIGETELVINGSGFTYEGTISQIYIDKDGVAPFDLVLLKENGDFKIKEDGQITNVKIGTDLDEGEYKVCLLHTDRGLYISSNLLRVNKNGTVKIEAEYQYKPRYHFINTNYKYTVVISTIIITVLMILLVLVIFVLIFIVSKRYKEKSLSIKEMKSLLSGDVMPLLKNTSVQDSLRQRSLRGKLVGFTIVLVIVVTLFVTLQNGFNMVSTQEKTMISALENRIDVLLESLTSGVKNFLPTENDLEIGALPEQKNAMLEAKYVTILGKPNSSLNSQKAENNLAYVWATNDPDIESKVAEYGQNGILAGQTYVTDENLLAIINKFDNLNNEATEKVKDISQQISTFSSEITQLAVKTDLQSVTRRKELSDVTTKLRSELNNNLTEISAQNSNSFPIFNYDILSCDNTDYIYYKPVMYRSGTSNTYVHAVVLIEVSIQSLVDELYDEIKDVIISAALAALAALLLGSVGAWLLASLIVKPIKQLESHLEKVGTLMTKSVRERQRLEKEHIEISSKDEIGRLGDVVNKMTLSAGLAAYEEFLQLDGKAVQERFIPLLDGEGGRKLPIVKYNEEKLDLFAFYKGDSAVSGDYFDFRKLDNQWYVFIKCDISGHGVPAALLVSVVATKFKDFYYFNNWDYKKNGINLKKFVSAVNDFIFELGTRGKFSTINISLYNKNTGELFICNAGDNKIHILDGQTKELREIVLSNTPTAGGVSTDLVEMTAGGYKVEKTILNPGDVLYLYTDGIDEAERLVRDRNFEVKQTVREEVKINHATGKEEKISQIMDQKEQFGEERIKQIIEAVLKKKRFVLTKKDNPNSSELLEFDFTNCQGTIDESIVALASVERVFRMIKTPNVKVSDEIEVDKIVDDFLQKHFTLYKKYCMPVSNLNEENTKLTKEEIDRQKQLEDPNVTKYSFLLEDKQADDITLIAIRRP